MDFAQLFPCAVCWIRKGTRFPQPFAGIEPPAGHATWQTEYGFVGITAAIPLGSLEFPAPFFTDGMNEKGLSLAGLWLPGTKYGTATVTTVSALDVGSLVLGLADSVASAKELLNGAYNVVAPRSPLEGTPLHFVITDATGACCVAEWLDGTLTLSDVLERAVTNAPEFGWHTKNLTNYENLSPYNVPAPVWGQPINGSGMLGLPGDATPPSRFVRATKMASSLYRPKDSPVWPVVSREQNAVAFAIELLRTVMVPRGTAVNLSQEKDYPDGDFTQWAVVRDHSNLNYYFWSAWNQRLNKVDIACLAHMSLGSLAIPIVQGDWFVDVTSQMKPFLEPSTPSGSASAPR